MMKITTRGTVCLRETSDGKPSRTISGCAIRFNEESVELEPGLFESIAPEAATKEFLDGQDIKMTMYHNREKLLARSNKGIGTLSYDVRDDGVWFEFEAPETPDGETALKLVERGDLAGCSFAFQVDRGCIKIEKKDGKTMARINKMLSVLDFTLAADPAYPTTSVGLRELCLEPGHQAREMEKYLNTKKQNGRIV